MTPNIPKTKIRIQDFPWSDLVTINQLGEEMSYTGKDTGKHYRKEYKGIKLDPYRIADVYGITDHAVFTILKKSLRCGSWHKTVVEDLQDIICAAQRAIEMIREDSNAD